MALKGGAGVREEGVEPRGEELVPGPTGTAREEEVLGQTGREQSEKAGPSNKGSLPLDLSLGKGRASAGGGWGTWEKKGQGGRERGHGVGQTRAQDAGVMVGSKEPEGQKGFSGDTSGHVREDPIGSKAGQSRAPD
ncbi:hypothetical protein NDU88_003690 [Pleurodeles waltl]|uniref:Uncharacterized protein n=1 Tax=Pleurodeles waltl TaxID=8319 RepID=A0AAV7MSY2_PLEWA|nr:hypothetical protein NDU88_003690 [Pleurodeles waltl]